MISAYLCKEAPNQKSSESELPPPPEMPKTRVFKGGELKKSDL